MVLKKFHLDYRKKRGILILFGVFLALIIYLFKDSSFVLQSVSAFGVMVFFYLVDHIYDIRFRKRHYVFMFAIVILSFLNSSAYYIWPNYDKIQHFIQPMFVCSIVFYMINRLSLELKWKLVFLFFIVVAILGLFEVGEFTLDSLFDLKLQGVYLRDAKGLEKFNILMDPLKDTMIDMVLGVIGAISYCTFFALYEKRKLHHKLFREV